MCDQNENGFVSLVLFSPILKSIIVIYDLVTGDSLVWHIYLPMGKECTVVYTVASCADWIITRWEHNILYMHTCTQTYTHKH